MCAQRKGHVRTLKATPYKPRREASGEIKPADTWILDFWLSKPREINFSCLSHPLYDILLWQPEKTNAQAEEFTMRVSSLFSLFLCCTDLQGRVF